MLDKKQSDAYKKYIFENLSKKRAQHSFNVAEEAVKLAKHYGADDDKAYTAGILHDACKELDPQKQYELAVRCELNPTEIELNSPPLLHAIAGAQLVKEHFSITDKEILGAIRYHTVACKNMTKLEKLIYLADLISAERDYKDVKKMRKYCYQSIEKGMLEALRFSIADSASKGNTIPLCTLEAYNEAVIAWKKHLSSVKVKDQKSK